MTSPRWTEDGDFDEQGGGEGDEDGKGAVGELAQAEGVEDVGEVLKEEAPGGAVEGVHLLPAADVPWRAGWGSW